MKKGLKYTLISVGSLLGLVFVTAVSYVSYVLIQYNRIEDNLKLDIEQKSTNEFVLDADKTYSVSTYNIGFGAYRPDFSFFMDKGVQSDGIIVKGKSARAKSKESVIEATNGVVSQIQGEDVDFALYQEVDTSSDRSWHVNQHEMISEAFSSYDTVFANNYHSAYLFYPFYEPIGKSNSGLTTLSKYKMDEAIRYSFPLSKKLDKFFDLDRCFSATRFNIADGKDFVLVNMHMSAYDKGGVIRAKQIEKLCLFFEEEVAKGNYVIVGGDFNHDLLAENPKFQYNEENPQPEWKNFSQLRPDWVANINYEEDITDSMNIATSDNAPTCRGADLPYLGNEDVLYKSVIDGFIVSDNIEVVSIINIDNGFEYSDHQPVKMEFKFKM